MIIMQHVDDSVGSRTAALHSGMASGMRRTRIHVLSRAAAFSEPLFVMENFVPPPGETSN